MLVKVLYPLLPTKETIDDRAQFIKLQVKEKINAELKNYRNRLSFLILNLFSINLDCCLVFLILALLRVFFRKKYLSRHLHVQS